MKVSRTPLGQIDTIAIRGSADDDILIAEFKSGEPLAGLELLFDGGAGGADTLILAEDAAGESESFSDVTHQISETGQNRIAVISSIDTTSVQYVGVEAVNDQLTAQDRTFIVDASAREITLEDDGAADDGVSQIVVSDSGDPSSVLTISSRASRS